MADPENYDAYVQRCTENQRMTGFLHETTLHAPCPFCGAADYSAIPIAQAERAASNECTCKECGRSGKVVLNRSSDGVRLEFVQTGGSNPPPWLPIPVRRI